MDSNSNSTYVLVDQFKSSLLASVSASVKWSSDELFTVMGVVLTFVIPALLSLGKDCRVCKASLVTWF